MLKKNIKKTARKLGIDIVGFTKNYDKNHIRKKIENKQKKGYSTEFEKIDIEKRINPKLLLNSYKTIIAIGISYNMTNKEEESKGYFGKFLKSAWGKDYHKVMHKKAEMLIEKVAELRESRNYIGVDTTPLLDREIGFNSGLGNFGKNTNIINSEYGSFIFIGYILTELDIEKVEKNKMILNGCKDCDICVRSCPTGALNGDYTMNSNKCISYLTQTRNEIPYSLREKMGNSIYGCDICQNCCPKNKNVKKANLSNFYQGENYGNKKIELLKLLKLTNKEFLSTYRWSSSGWRGRNILRRNAIIAIGNIKIKEYISYLEEHVFDKSDMIAKYSIWSIYYIDSFHGKNLYKKYEFKFKKEIIYEIENIENYLEGRSNSVK